MKKLAAAALAVLVASTGCAASGPTRTPAPEPTVTVTLPASAASALASPTPTLTTAVALGAWSASCSQPDADAAALVANITAQPMFAGAKPSAVTGWTNAITTAARPLGACAVRHLMAVASKVAIATDPQATTSLAGTVRGLALGRPLDVSGTAVGELSLGKAGMADAKALLTAILGQPTRTTSGGCDLSGEKWTDMTWNGFSVAFDEKVAGKPLIAWEVRANKAVPGSVALAGNVPMWATMAQLTAVSPGLKQSSVFGGGPPYTAEVKPGVTFGWDGDPAAKNDWVVGGRLRLCE